MLSKIFQMLKWNPEPFKSAEDLTKYITKKLKETNLASQKEFIAGEFKGDLVGNLELK